MAHPDTLRAAALLTALQACSAAETSNEELVAPQQAASELPPVPATPAKSRVEALDGAPALRQPDLTSCIAELRKGVGIARSSAIEAGYDVALASEARGDLRAARDQYYRVIVDAPSSRLVPLVYLAFGESFAREAVADPNKWQLARAAYQEALNYPPETNPASAYAHLRLGDSMLALGEPVRALDEFTKAVRAARAPDAPCSEPIQHRASEGLVDAYAGVGKPERAHAFFRVVVGSDDTALALLATLAKRYLERGSLDDACALVRSAPSSLTRLDDMRRRCTLR